MTSITLSLKKVFLTLLCLKILLIDPFTYSSAKGEEDNFNLVKLQSLPVSFNTSLLPSTISLNSLPVSFSLSNSASSIKLSSVPVSFNTSISPSALTISSRPVSYLLSKAADLIKISSLPVSYSLNSYNGNFFKVSSEKVSYKTFNGIPIIDEVSPNLLPVSNNGKSIDVSIKGNNFANNSIASIGTSKIQTKFNSSKELIATIPSNFLEKENSFEIYVTNPPPEGGISKSFNVMVIEPIPIVKINATPSVGVTPQIVTFDGRDTEDLLVKYFGQELSYVWDFGEKDTEINTSTNAVATHVYKNPGKYFVTLTASNSYGHISKVTKEIEIRDKDEAPVIDVSYTTKETDDYSEAIFDASMTIDPENDPISFNWDLGDGTENTEKTFAYRFTRKGTYIPKVTAVDSLGVSSIKFLDPITYLGPNIPPTPVTNISPATGYLSLKQDNSIATPIFLVKLSAKDSFDKDGSITKYTWTISEDRGQNSEVREGQEVTYEFTKAGTYNVKLTVTDDRNRTVEKIDTIKVLKPDPIASASVDKTSGNAPLTVQFKSDGSRDFDGSLVSAKWNFGDGKSDSIEPNPIHTYDSPGAYLATLIVLTPDGRIKKTNTKTILVTENNGPQGVISVLEPIKLGIPNEAIVKLSAKGSYDPQKNQMLSYSWSWIAHQLNKDKNLIDVSDAINKQLQENTNEEFSYTFIAPGQYTPVLEVKTEDSRATKVNGGTITIVPGQEPISIAKILSEKLNGFDSLTVKFDASGSFDPKTDGQIISYLWEFGDGQTSSEISPEHTYNTPGTYNAKLIIQDNRGFKSIALANTVKIATTEAQKNTEIQNKEKFIKFQSNGDPSLLPQDEAFSFSFAQDEKKPMDSKAPQITLQIENPEIKVGEVLFIKAHITDDIGIETVGYKLVDKNNHTIIEEIEAAPGNNQIDEFMSHIDYVKDILIPEDTQIGKYKLLLFAKDKADNWIGKFDTNQIVSSDINVIGKIEEKYSTLIKGEESDEKPEANTTHELVHNQVN